MMKIGDIVYLKSGSPPMTITSLFKEREHDSENKEEKVDKASCSWFCQKYLTIVSSRIVLSALTKDEPKKSFEVLPISVSPSSEI